MKAQLKPTTHEPYLYSAMIENSLILMLRQIEDFTITVKEAEIAYEIIKTIDKHLGIHIIFLGQVPMFNDLNII